MTPESAASTQLVGLAVGNLVGTGVGGSLAPPPSSSPPSPVDTSSGSGSPSQSTLRERIVFEADVGLLSSCFDEQATL